MKNVILPETCRGDWMDVPAEVRKDMKAHFVKDIAQLVSVALTK